MDDAATTAGRPSDVPGDITVTIWHPDQATGRWRHFAQTWQFAQRTVTYFTDGIEMRRCALDKLWMPIPDNEELIDREI